MYLCAQSLFKLHPVFDEVVFQILEKDPDGFIVFTKGRREKWTKIFVERLRNNSWNKNELFERIIFIERVNSLDFDALIRLSDVMLHPFPFGGSRTSVDGLKEGIPVVTFPQKFLRGRMAVSFYATMGIWDCCVANDVAEVRRRATKHTILLRKSKSGAFMTIANNANTLHHTHRRSTSKRRLDSGEMRSTDGKQPTSSRIE